MPPIKVELNFVTILQQTRAVTLKRADGSGWHAPITLLPMRDRDIIKVPQCNN
jgi:hypothetical protein